MKLYQSFEGKKLFVALLGILCALTVLLVFPTECRNGATNGVFLCLQVLIPSLFPYMIVSDFAVSSRLLSHTPRAIGFLCKKLFALPKEASGIILLALIGGFPVGAKGIKALWDNGHINRTEAERMAMFCVASGPGFTVTYLGAVMMRNIKLGYILLVSQTVSVLLLGLLARLLRKEKAFANNISNNTAQKDKCIGQKDSLLSALLGSVASAIKASALMCGLVVLFSAFCEVYLRLTESIVPARPFVAMLEITTGTKVLCEGYSPVLLAFCCGFGGLCVHMQIFSILGKIKISKIKFCFFRLMQGVLSALFTFSLLRLFPEASEVFSTVSKASPRLYGSVTGCVLLVVCCVLFLLSIQSFKLKHKFR
ncbi:MAG: hypothetical protein ACI4GZ_00120 [Ruminococcus sp.]